MKTLFPIGGVDVELVVGQERSREALYQHPFTFIYDIIDLVASRRTTTPGVPSFLRRVRRTHHCSVFL